MNNEISAKIMKGAICNLPQWYYSHQMHSNGKPTIYPAVVHVLENGEGH